MQLTFRLPPLAAHNFRNDALVYCKQCRKLTLGNISLGIKQTDSTYVFPCQLGVGACFSPTHPALEDCIGHIVLMCAEKQMRRVDTRSVVAIVAPIVNAMRGDFDNGLDNNGGQR